MVLEAYLGSMKKIQKNECQYEFKIMLYLCRTLRVCLETWQVLT